jgi:hypothetical protein|tara:strand:+ start:1672 stop:2049 length:378 start_codon:yes stop_codon:yes gene_type:complete
MTYESDSEYEFPEESMRRVQLKLRDFPNKTSFFLETVITSAFEVIVDINESEDKMVKSVLRGLVRFHPQNLSYLVNCFEDSSNILQAKEDKLDSYSDKLSENPRVVEHIKTKLLDARRAYLRELF